MNTSLAKINGDTLASWSPTPLEENPAAVYLGSLAKSGRRSMMGKLAMAARLLGHAHEDPLKVPWHELQFQHVIALRTKLQEIGLAASTVNTTLYAIRGVINAAYSLGLVAADQRDRVLEVKVVSGERELAGRMLSPNEIKALMRISERNGRGGTRDAAAIAVLYATGMRRSEIVSLDVDDLDLEHGRLRVIGKGNKERIMWLATGAKDALADWLRIRGEQPGPLFTPVDAHGRVQFRRMTAQAIYNMVRTRAKQAGIKRLSPHDLRRTFVSNLFDNGIDIVTVQQMAGHASPTTTARYDRRDEEAKKRAAESLKVPYRGSDTEKEREADAGSPNDESA